MQKENKVFPDDNDEFVDKTKIKAPGNLPKTIMGQYLDMMKGKFNPIEEMELMQATIDSTELNNSYNDIYSTTSVVGGLVIAFCFSATQARFSGTTEVATIWSSLASMQDVQDVYGLLIGLALVFAFFSIIYSMLMTTMLAQIPKHATNLFFDLLGLVRVQIVFILQYVTLFLFLFATLLQISANYSVWVSIVIFVLVGLGIISVIIVAGSTQIVRLELLRRVFSKYSQRNVQNKTSED